MSEQRRRRKNLDLETLKRGRALGKSYAKIGAELGVDPSSVWYALNRKKDAEARPVPAGVRRTIYITPERWQVVSEWAKAAGVSWSAMLGEVVDHEQAWREQNQPLSLEEEHMEQAYAPDGSHD